MDFSLFKFSALVMTLAILIATLPRTAPVDLRSGTKTGNKSFTKIRIAVSS